MLDGFKSVTMYALFLDGSDQSFDHPILLWAMRGNELLLQAIALDQSRVAAGREDQPIIGSKQKRRFDFAQSSVPADERLLKCSLSRSGAARAR